MSKEVIDVWHWRCEGGWIWSLLPSDSLREKDGKKCERLVVLTAVSLSCWLRDMTTNSYCMTKCHVPHIIGNHVLSQMTSHPCCLGCLLFEAQSKTVYYNSLKQTYLLTDKMSLICCVCCARMWACVQACTCASLLACLRFESTLTMCYNDGLSATTAADICWMSLSTYTERETRAEANNLIKTAMDYTWVIQNGK